MNTTTKVLLSIAAVFIGLIVIAFGAAMAWVMIQFAGMDLFKALYYGWDPIGGAIIFTLLWIFIFAELTLTFIGIGISGIGILFAGPILIATAD